MCVCVRCPAVEVEQMLTLYILILHLTTLQLNAEIKGAFTPAVQFHWSRVQTKKKHDKHLPFHVHTDFFTKNCKHKTTLTNSSLLIVEFQWPAILQWDVDLLEKNKTK